MRRLAPILPALLVVASALLVATLTNFGLLRNAESAAFDLWVTKFHLSRIAPWPADFATVVIDQPAIEKLSLNGQWPIHRTNFLRLWKRISALGAKTIVIDGTFRTRTDPATDAEVVAGLGEVVEPVAIGHTSTRQTSTSAALERALLATRVTRGIFTREDQLLPPLEEFAAAGRGLGHVYQRLDPDGMARLHYPLIAVSGTAALPSIALVSLALQRDADLRAAHLEKDTLVVPGLPPLALTNGAVTMELSRALAPPQTLTALDVLDGTDDARLRKALAGKLVLVYAQDDSDRKQSPLGPQTDGGLLLAHAIRTLAAGHSPRRVPLASFLIPLVALVALGTPLAMRVAPRSIAVVALAATIGWPTTHAILFSRSDLFLPLVGPTLFLALSGLAIFVYRTRTVIQRLDVAEARADADKAPRGEIALVFTDVQGSTALWEHAPKGMARALELHNALFRELLPEARGYEVKTEGDAFMLSFHDARSALAWCLTVQERLLALDWPAEVVALPDAAEERDASGALLRRGLRVRMGIHVGSPDPRVDPLTGRMDYFGPPVNRAARVSGAAHGGQIVVSGDAWAKVKDALAQLPEARTRDLGRHFLKGLLSDEQLVEIVPAALAARTFAPLKTASGPGERPTSG